MVKILNELTPIAASGMLAKIAKEIAYAPQAEIALTVNKFSSLEKSILEEIISTKGIDPTLSSFDSREKLLYELDKMSNDIVPVKIDSEVLENLGENGLIAFDALKPDFRGLLFEYIPRTMKQDKKIAFTTIKNPDKQEVNRVISDGFGDVSFYAKSFNVSVPSKLFILLVISRQVGTKLHVPQYWRIYPSDLDLRGVFSLYEMYVLFLKKFGVILSKKEAVNLSKEIDRNDQIKKIYEHQVGFKANYMFSFTFYQRQIDLLRKFVKQDEMPCGVNLELYLNSLLEKNEIRKSFFMDLEKIRFIKHFP